MTSFPAELYHEKTRYFSQGYCLDGGLVCALKQVKFDTYASDTYSFAKQPNSTSLWLFKTGTVSTHF